jgi:Extracellular link domain
MEVSPNSTTEPLNMYDYINKFFMNPAIFTGFILVITIGIIIYLSLGSSSGQNSDSSQSYNTSGGDQTTKIYGIIGVTLFVILVILNGFQYYFGMDFYASIKNLISRSPEIDIKVFEQQKAQQKAKEEKEESQEHSQSKQMPTQTTSSPPQTGTSIEEDMSREQVFNIPGNKYGYDDSKALCTAYGARLATYNEIESAYNSGGEWCNYGWSDGQMALFPTQKSTFENLQKIKGHENDCGRPGINGGYIANPLVKFGVNCYGHKPKINQQEQNLMNVTTPYPLTNEDLAMEQRVSYWKGKLNEILVSPFNSSSWNKI